MKKLSLLLLIATSLLAGCKFGSTEKSEKAKASVRLNWLTTCSFAGEVAGAQKFADKNSLELKLETGGPGLDPIKLVQSGENTFGLAGADLVLSANDKGGDFVIVGLVNYDAPGVWVSKAEKNIKSIQDITPKTRIGELPGGNMIYLYEVFLKKSGLVRNKNFTPVPIPFELKGFITGDECELRPIFIYEVLPELDLLGIKYNVIEPKNLGISFKGLCYFTKRKTVEEHPEMVQNFVNTMIEGWDYALNNPDSSIAMLKKFDNGINVEKELLGLKAGEEYFKGYNGKLLYSDNDSWHLMIKDMRELGFLKNDVDLKKVLDLSFVENYYKKKNAQ